MDRRRVVAAMAVLAFGVAGCGGDDVTGPDAASASTTASIGSADRTEADGPGIDPHLDVTANPANDVGPGVESFDAPAEVTCEAGGTAVVPVTWSAPAARSVGFLVDQVSSTTGAPTTGTIDLEVPCDDAVHVITLVAIGDGEIPTVRSEAVRTTVAG